MTRRILERHMLNGVTVEDPASTCVEPRWRSAGIRCFIGERSYGENEDRGKLLLGPLEPPP